MKARLDFWHFKSRMALMDYVNSNMKREDIEAITYDPSDDYGMPWVLFYWR